MTLYHVMKQSDTFIWREVRNKERDDGRWEASGPDEAVDVARRILYARGGTFLAVPQHRFHIRARP